MPLSIIGFNRSLNIRETFEISNYNTFAQGDQLLKLWAKHKIDAILNDPSVGPEEAIKISKKYCIPCKLTSFICIQENLEKIIGDLKQIKIESGIGKNRKIATNTRKRNNASIIRSGYRGGGRGGLINQKFSRQTGLSPQCSPSNSFSESDSNDDISNSPIRIKESSKNIVGLPVTQTTKSNTMKMKRKKNACEIRRDKRSKERSRSRSIGDQLLINDDLYLKILVQQSIEGF